MPDTATAPYTASKFMLLVGRMACGNPGERKRRFPVAGGNHSSDQCEARGFTGR